MSNGSSKKKRKSDKGKKKKAKKKKKTAKKAGYSLLEALQTPKAVSTAKIVHTIKTRPETWADAKDRHNRPYLHVLLEWYPVASSPRGMAVLNALLEANVDPDETDNMPHERYNARENGNPEQRGDMTALERALLGDVSVVQDAHLIIRHLLTAGASPSRRDTYGWTYLHGTSCMGSLSQIHFIDELIRGGADINARNAEGRTALHLSLKNVHPGAYFHRLVRLGADSRLRDNSGRTALGRVTELPLKYGLRRVPRQVRVLIEDYKTRQTALDAALKLLVGVDDLDGEEKLGEAYATSVLNLTDGADRLQALEALQAEIEALIGRYNFPPSPPPRPTNPGTTT